MGHAFPLPNGTPNFSKSSEICLPANIVECASVGLAAGLQNISSSKR